MKRREFLTLVGCSAVTLTVASVAGVDRTLALAATDESVSSAEEQTLSAAVARIVPHENAVLKDQASQTARALAAKMKTDPALRDSLKRVITELNDQSHKAFDKDFASLIPEQQIMVMDKVQSSGAFQTLVNQVLADYYDKPDVWHELGYPGPVNDHEHMDGGYLAKGFDRLDW
jgi:hypothetical protein